MFPLFKKKQKPDVAVLEKNLAAAFSRVSADISHIRAWINHLHLRDEQLHQSHHSYATLARQDLQNLGIWVHRLHSHSKRMQSEFELLVKKFTELKQSHDCLVDKISLLEKKMDSAHEPTLSSSPNQVRTKSVLKSELEPALASKKHVFASQITSSQKDAFEQTVMRHIRPHKKEYILQQIMSVITVQNPPVKELEHIIVREKQLCGRTTFYAYLKELRLLGKLSDKRLVKSEVTP